MTTSYSFAFVVGSLSKLKVEEKGHQEAHGVCITQPYFEPGSYVQVLQWVITKPCFVVTTGAFHKALRKCESV